MSKITNLIIVSFAVLAYTPIYGQITAPTANYADTTSYRINKTPDSIYFFNPQNNSVFLRADTSAHRGYNIKWEKYDSANSYSFLSNDYIINSTADTIALGYRLTQWNDTDTVVTRCWILQNNFKVQILTKDEEGNLSSGAYTSECAVYGPIQVKLTQSALNYYNPETGIKLVYKPKYSLAWTKEKDVSQGNIVYKGLFSNNIYKYNVTDAYWEDMLYMVEVKDSSGTINRDTVNVRSINPKAKMEFEYITLDDQQYYPDKDTNYYFFYSSTNNKDVISAPALFIFISKSENAHQFVWEFADSTAAFVTTKDSVLKEFVKWGDFKVKLTAQHQVKWWTQTCTAVDSLPIAIKINQPKLLAPNVFCINSSYYPAWRFEDVSITDFEILIFSRTGIKIHEFKGNIRDWNGWDGKFRNSDSFVSNGVYFYVVKDYSAIANIDEDIENPKVWGEGNKDGTTTKTSDTSPSENTSESNSKEESNSEYRGFFHVFCSE